MPTAETLEEAREWFLSNSSGVLNCVSGERQMICASYPEAEQFFNQVAIASEE